MLLWGLLVSKIEEEDAGQGANQEDDIKPSVVEVELELPQDLRDYGAIFQRHAHTHKQHRGHEIHPLKEKRLCSFCSPQVSR